MEEVVSVGWCKAHGKKSVVRRWCAAGQAASKERCPGVALELHPLHSGKGIGQTENRVLLDR